MGRLTLLGAGTVVAAAASTTTFDPSNLGTGNTLSGGNLVATQGGGSGANYAVARSLTSHSTGKYYVEFTITNNAGNDAFVNVGAANSSAPLTNGGLGFDGAADSVGLYGSSASVFLNNTAVGTATTYTQADIISIAVDAGAQLIWFRKGAGNWNNNVLNIPATGVGGISIASIAAPYFAGVSITGTGGSITANFGATAYANFDSSVTGYGNW